uniref:Uncharacterized protein n=1 Tax=Panagrolaimus davidi TaxID=227884 RepID=A0A914PB50_9BILA
MEACKREDTIEELLNEQHILKKEILDLHRQNYALENDKEKLINELINFGIAENEENQEIMEASPNNDEETQTGKLLYLRKKISKYDIFYIV